MTQTATFDRTRAITAVRVVSDARLAAAAQKGRMLSLRLWHVRVAGLAWVQRHLAIALPPTVRPRSLSCVQWQRS